PDVVTPGGGLAERLEHRLRLQRVVASRVAVRELLAPSVDLPAPCLRALAVGGAQLAYLAREVGEGDLEGADDRDVRAAELPDLGRVDVEVDHLRAGREGGELARDAVVEARAAGD